MVAQTGGVYLSLDGGPDGSRIGPFDEIALRGALAVGERAGLGKVIAVRSSAGSWRDAESSSAESKAATGGCRELRVSAADRDVVVRFSGDEAAGHVSVPDLGPFAVVIVGTHVVRGNEDTLAVRVSQGSPWQVTDRAGATFQGATIEALVFVATGRAGASQARDAAMSASLQSRPEPAESDAAMSTGAADEQAPSVWVERVRTAPEIYVSRPNRKR